jgi:hypothetical protein
MKSYEGSNSKVASMFHLSNSTEKKRQLMVPAALYYIWSSQLVDKRLFRQNLPLIYEKKIILGKSLYWVG